MIKFHVSVIIPVAVYVVMSLIDKLAKPLSLRNSITKAGWDLCLLAMGITGGVFVDDAVIGRLSHPTAIVYAILAFLTGIFFALIITHLQSIYKDKELWWVSLLSIFLGIVSISIPAYFILSS
ncbi:MAG: hypothetical protein OMM_10035 [Candidatus Magnetoglobus multicellularis str. Araruama]|uniref:Uncharacterized protein n=1 Tax=Candidatus Magnetoglobus multicellularis str. Araruama TaxID=890399 RepID=A0A1V1P2B0_9BACT|nr:MAG: hypothetical protein OMM_10035 [Candidatus Magnetoglobus multicellularis str. Araruama]